MKIGRACAIFEQINSDKYSEQEKLNAIRQVIEMPTHNGITKDEILNAFKWFFDWAVEEANRKQTNADRIRSMSDEDLAMNMMCPNENGLGEINCDKSDNFNCYECILKWLQSEVEE